MSSTGGSIILPDSEWEKIQDYTRLCPVEIACMGYAKLEGNNVLVDEVFLVPQVISLSAVQFLDEGFPYAVEKAIEDDRVDELRFIWHSHATHEAYWSNVDEDMIEKMHAGSPTPWFANLVLNKKGDTHARIDWFDVEGEFSNFTNHIALELDFEVEGIPKDRADMRMEEMESFCERERDYKARMKAASKGQTAAESDDTGDDWTVIHEGESPLEAIPVEKTWTPKITSREWKLHNHAKEKKWDCYVKDDVAYYWLAETGEFKGSASIPLDKDGDWKIDIEVTVFDADSEEIEPGTDVVPYDDEERMLLAATAAGQLH